MPPMPPGRSTDLLREGGLQLLLVYTCRKSTSRLNLPGVNVSNAGWEGFGKGTRRGWKYADSVHPPLLQQWQHLKQPLSNTESTTVYHAPGGGPLPLGPQQPRLTQGSDLH